MAIHPHGPDRNSLHRAASIAIGIAVNVFLGFVVTRLKLPFYFDTIGTIAVAAIGGYFPGMMVAILTNIISSLFISDSIYFSTISVLIALFTSWYVRKYDLKRLGRIANYIIVITLISAGLGAFIQWGLFGDAQGQMVYNIINTFEEESITSRFLIFFIVNFSVNLVDKIITTLVAALIIGKVPEALCYSIANSGWKQRPLSDDDIKQMSLEEKKLKRPIKKRITYIIVGSALTLVFVLVSIGMSLYFQATKNDRMNNAKNAARFVAEIIDTDRIDDYITRGEQASGYNETRDMMKKIRTNSPYVENLYVVKVQKEGLVTIFDLGTDTNEAFSVGKFTEPDENIKPYLERLIKGEEIEPIETSDGLGWRMDVMHPVIDDGGNCVCYAGAMVSMRYLADYMQDFLIRVFLILAGFLLLILATAMWITGYYIVYPINSIATSLGQFAESGDDQKKLDEKVRRLRLLDIHTGDEIEKMYSSMCDMAAGMSEKIRDIRYYTDSTAKMQNSLIITMADMAENRALGSGAHIQKSSAYVKIILDGLKKKGYYAEKLTPRYIADVEMSAPLHDVGKISIPDSILNKPGKLTEEEFEIMKTHATIGRDIMEKAISTVRGENYLKEARNIAAYHHEKWDGSGYPEGLHGEVIPLSARVMAVADVLDALTSPRVYKQAVSLDKALEIIRAGAGTQFDPKCVEALMDSVEDIKVVLMKYQDK